MVLADGGLLMADVLGTEKERLLEAGALDVYATPVLMKKNRPGTKLSVIVRCCDLGRIEELLFAETTTFGLRRWRCRRSKLQRQWQEVQTQYGPIRIKIGRRGGKVVTASPEYEDCAAAAQKHGAALRTVTAAATATWQGQQRSD